MQCGIICLQMICKHHGKEYSLEPLSRQCFATTEGISLLGVSEAANKLGLYTISRIKEDMPVSIEMEGYNARTYGHLNGKVKTIHKEVLKKEGKNYFRADLKLDNAVDYHIMKEGMEGTATILLSDRSLAQYLLPAYLRKTG